MLNAIGLVLILLLPLHAGLRATGCVVWACSAYLEIARLEAGFRRCIEIRLHASGEVEIADNDGEWSPARLLPGSLVLTTLGWLRLQTIDGQIILQPVRGDARKDHDWRRLQVIWRHIGAARRSC